MSDQNDRALAQARAQFESIYALVSAIRAARDADDDNAIEAAIQAVNEDALSVEVRSGWYAPGSKPSEPEEYCVLLSTGGPATRITGAIGSFGQAGSARIEYQDWFEPWTEYRGDPNERGERMFPGELSPSEAEDVLREYVGCFYLGDG